VGNYRKKDRGTAILLISEDLYEILSLPDRIAAIYEGRVIDVLSRADATPETRGLLMARVRAADTR
jgi:simple sugar transport system ATP-binding protein